MNKLVRYYDNKNEPIIKVGDDTLKLTYFNIVKLDKGKGYTCSLKDYETVWVVMQGNIDIQVDDKKYSGIGQRENIWKGRADSVYAGSGANVNVVSNENDTEIAVAGGYCPEIYDSFRITPDEVEMVDVGSTETKSHRKIFHILGQNANGRAGNLLVSELNCEEGCWSGYPPHKHDTENPPEETEFEEIYHYRFNPGNGFGGQYVFDGVNEPQAYMTRNGDTFAFSSGYHPTVTSPGHEEYVLTIIVGKHQRSLIQNFKEEYRYMNEKIPGISGMVDKFK